MTDLITNFSPSTQVTLYQRKVAFVLLIPFQNETKSVQRLTRVENIKTGRQVVRDGWEICDRRLEEL
ncbi:hypothetical protein evm_005157 [Chilo suppressalis]|nr:hypothetical protein evm_005157 [Chilo suppressalis]